MNKETIIEIITVFLGRTSYKIYNNWVMTSCPFAPYLHEDGDDRRFSFGISLQGYYHCFACGSKGHIKKLPYELAKYKHLNPLFAQYVSKIKTDKPKLTTTQPAQPIKTDLSLFPPAQPVLSLSQEDIEKFQIKQHGDILLFPIYDNKQRLVSIYARKISEKAFFYYEGNAKVQGVWYGEHLLANAKSVVITEGVRDTILFSRFFPTIASLGTPSMAQIKRLKQFGLNLYLAFDNDKTGQYYTQKLIKYLGNQVKGVAVFKAKDLAELVEKHGENTKHFIRFRLLNSLQDARKT